MELDTEFSYLKGLVVITNYGTKNTVYLDKLISEYNSMSFKMKVVVLSEAEKYIGDDIEVVVGLPSKNPWSLPFGHKKILAENVDNYDFFIYSEDDTLITERNINAFLNVTKILPDDKIAGFIRYEKYNKKEKYYTTIHSHYHWDPDSVETIDQYTFAHLTNQHSACYILTRKQLKKVISTGKFLTEPREGEYDMLCTAATDPYTVGGLKKVICISHIEDYSLHHLPNVYNGIMGIKQDELVAQLDALKRLKDERKAVKKLLNKNESDLNTFYKKKYYEPIRQDILKLVPRSCKKVISIGCGCGDTEYVLVKNGKKVSGIPIDSVIGEIARSKGIDILPPNLNLALKKLKDEKFDCLLFIDILHLLDGADFYLKEFIQRVKQDGFVIVSTPNRFNLSYLKKKILVREGMKNVYHGNDYNSKFLKLQNYKKWKKKYNLKYISTSNSGNSKYYIMSKKIGGILDILFASRYLVQFQKY